MQETGYLRKQAKIAGITNHFWSSKSSKSHFQDFKISSGKFKKK